VADYWTGLLDWLRNRPAQEGKIAPSDIDLVTVTDDPGEAVEIIRAGARDQGLDPAGRPAPESGP
jgi:predicted Rossmann-fold nucleotide-binding protein